MSVAVISQIFFNIKTPTNQIYIYILLNKLKVEAVNSISTLVVALLAVSPDHHPLPLSTAFILNIYSVTVE